MQSVQDFQVIVNAMANTVFDALGPGHSETVYRNAMLVELRLQGVPYESEKVVAVMFKDHCVGTVRFDIVIMNRFLVELKAVEKLRPVDKLQVKKYLTISKKQLECGLLINFAPAGIEACALYGSA